MTMGVFAGKMSVPQILGIMLCVQPHQLAERLVLWAGRDPRLVFSSTFAASWRLVVGQLLVVGTFAPTWRV